MPVALEREHHVDEVLKHPRAGNGTVFGHVPDEQHGDAGRLRRRNDARRHLAHLGHVAGLPLDLRAGDRLNRVDDDELRAQRLDLAEYEPEVGLGCQVEAGRSSSPCP